MEEVEQWRWKAGRDVAEGEERRGIKAVQRLEEEEFLQTKTIPLDTIRGELEL